MNKKNLRKLWEILEELAFSAYFLLLIVNLKVFEQQFFLHWAGQFAVFHVCLLAHKCAE